VHVRHCLAWKRSVFSPVSATGRLDISREYAAWEADSLRAKSMG
jgi:hypothetical protein